MMLVRKLIMLALVAPLAVGCGKDDNNGQGTNNPVADMGTEDTGGGGGGDTGDNNGADMGGTEDMGGGEIVPFSDDCTVTLGPGADADANYAAIQNALFDASEGDVICLVDGRYDLAEEVSLDVANVEIRGESREGTVLDFSGQEAGANGVSATSDDVVFADLTVQNTPGDGIRVTGADGVTFRNINVTWSGGPQGENGAYGIYPVQCQNVLVEDSTVSYASDAGVYVGQSMNVIVRNNEAFGNVAGIEIENTTGAEVYDNHSYENTGGLLIFDLPGPPVQGGKRNKIRNNLIENNNEPNFAEPGNIVGLVPAGTGILVLSSDENEIHDNTITGNQSIGVTIASFQTTGLDYSFNPDFDPFAEGNWVHDNTFANNGQSPAGFASLITQGGGITMLEPLTWDGVLDDAKDNSDGSLTNCFSNNTDDGSAAGYRNFNTDEGFSNQSTDIGDNDCTHDPLPATTLE